VYQPKRLSILHIILAVGETSAPYNEHCLPWADKRDITICTYFRSNMNPPKTITLFQGDDSLAGFFRALKAALDGKEYDIIHTHSPHVGFLLFAGMLFTRRKSLSFKVATVHDSYQNFKPRNRLMFVPVFATFQRVVCCGRASYDSFPAFFKQLAGDRFCCVQNGMDIARVDRLAADIPQGLQENNDFTITAISRLVDIKNPFSLLAAFKDSMDRNSRLIYIGDGPLRQLLVRKGREVAAKNQIEFTGLIPREKVFLYLLNTDLFVSTSRGEGLPIAVLEAMACRRPVILSDIPPHREITGGVDFIPLIPPGDVKGFAREILRFREMNVSQRSVIGQKCRELVEQQFSLPAMHAGYAKVYSQLTGYQIPSLSNGVR